MADIIININEFICEDPIITDVTWNGIRYEFLVDWTSQGAYYSTFDPSTTMELSMDIYETSNNILQYSGVIATGVPFDVNDYMFNVLDYYPTFSSKYQIHLKLKITNSGCDNTTTYIVPITYP
jgi:hypothetical protein